jgi:hypothetical protein
MVRATVVTLGAGLLLAAFGVLLAQQVVEQDVVTGEIVRVDTAANKVVIRTGPAGKVVERTFLFAPKARFFDPDEKVVVQGLRGPAFRPGVRVRFRVEPKGTRIMEFRAVRRKR